MTKSNTLQAKKNITATIVAITEIWGHLSPVFNIDWKEHILSRMEVLSSIRDEEEHEGKFIRDIKIWYIRIHDDFIWINYKIKEYSMWRKTYCFIIRTDDYLKCHC